MGDYHAGLPPRHDKKSPPTLFTEDKAALMRKKLHRWDDNICILCGAVRTTNQKEVCRPIKDGEIEKKYRIAMKFTDI